jgi:hypothetical protein
MTTARLTRNELRGRPLAERVRLQTERRGPDECWPWIGSHDRNGYGHLTRFGKQVRAHRVAWELANGREPRGCICHSCDNPACVNPAHLWEGSHADNMRDMHAKRRHPGGSFRRTNPETCRNGHSLAPENRIPNGPGRTTCRICRALQRKAA